MKSKSLERYLLDKYNLKDIKDLNLKEVDELILNKINGKEKTDYNFSDFEEFTNLKYLYLQNFTIRNYETNEIGRCKKIVAIQFSNCKFKSKARLIGDIKVTSFNNCNGVKIKYLSLLKNIEVLKISNCRKINLKRINNYFRNLERIYFENTKIYNFNLLAKLKKLLFIEVINCKWNKNSVRFFSENVKIEE